MAASTTRRARAATPTPAAAKSRSRGKTERRTDNRSKSAPPIPRLLYSVPEAGKALGISPATAYRLVRQGIIFAVEDFGAKKVPVKWLEDEIARRTALARTA